MLTAATAVLHASHLPPGSLWLAVAAVRPGAAKRLEDGLPQEFTDKIGGRIQRVRTAFQRWTEAAIGWETVRRRLTPAAKAAAMPKNEYQTTLDTIGRASLAVKDAIHAHDEALRAVEATRQRLHEAQEAFREAKKALPTIKQAYDGAMNPRQRELAKARSALRDARNEAMKAQRALAIDLAWLCVGDREILESTAARFQVSARYLRALLGEASRGLTADEQQEIIDRALMGTPVTILAVEYRTPRSWIYKLVNDHKRLGESESA